ncbi:hypothetical protein TorRG33x02_197840 [Trema orientale]|uniref:Uncharacterized protein n=1 Tax=Trema orientale TaxID=63057 RepID=A0A2P5EFX4_TREOI|nr:hypothetical protein TorRG33x02_197840 [Trema orientale]
MKERTFKIRERQGKRGVCNFLGSQTSREENSAIGRRSKIFCLDVFRVAEEIRVPARVGPVSGASLGQYGNLESAIWPFWGYDDVFGMKRNDRSRTGRQPRLDCFKRTDTV